MKAVEGIRRSGVGIEPSRTVREAAQLMNQAGVGALAVVDGERLVGIVTDRDLVNRAMAPGLPFDSRVDAVMTVASLTLEATSDLHDAYAVFRTHAVRRLPVVNGDKLVGMVTLDDLIIDLAGELADLVRPVLGEVLFPHREYSSVPATT